jgi:RES domain-containing protein
MPMLAYRMCENAYAKTLTASGFPARWNSKGNEVLYCSNDAALTCFENMLRRGGLGFANLYSLMTIEYPDNISIEWLQPGDPKLLPGWDDKTSYKVSQPIGDTWYTGNLSCILKVPSVVLPEAYNIVFNTKHPEFKKVKLLKAQLFLPDGRLEDILKKK